MQLRMIALYVLNVLGFSWWVGTSPIHDEKARLVKAGT